MRIEIYDERTLTDDELIAWVTLQIPETIYQVLMIMLLDFHSYLYMAVVFHFLFIYLFF